MAHTAIQSEKSQNKVAHLCYAIRDPYHIIQNTGYGSYYAKKINKPDSSELKCMTYNLYPLPPSLESCEPVNTADTQYLNQTNAPLVYLLKSALIIEPYNEKFFNKALPTYTPPFTYKYATLQFPNGPLTPFLSLVEFYQDTKTSPPKPFLEDTIHFIPTPHVPVVSHKYLINTDCLFFI